jgi:putative hydrolase of the HAD superfamily
MILFPAILEAVLFDAGGTLVRIDYAFIAEAAADLGFTVSERALLRGEAAARRAIDAFVETHGSIEGTDASRVRGYFENLLRGAGLPEDAIAPVIRAMEAGHAEANLWRVPLDGVFEVLAGLRARGVRAAVVSNGDGRIRGKLEELGLVQHLELVVDSFEEGVEKPDPEIFHRALRRLGVAPERAAYIGDIYSIDAVGARAAGLWPILIDPTGAYGAIGCRTIAGLHELLEGLG